MARGQTYVAPASLRLTLLTIEWLTPRSEVQLLLSDKAARFDLIGHQDVIRRRQNCVSQKMPRGPSSAICISDVLELSLPRLYSSCVISFVLWSLLNTGLWGAKLDNCDVQAGIRANCQPSLQAAASKWKGGEGVRAILRTWLSLYGKSGRVAPGHGLSNRKAGK